jgi:hypothetical protein
MPLKAAVRLFSDDGEALLSSKPEQLADGAWSPIKHDLMIQNCSSSGRRWFNGQDLGFVVRSAKRDDGHMSKAATSLIGNEFLTKGSWSSSASVSPMWVTAVTTDARHGCSDHCGSVPLLRIAR